jgi:hypothetical protein
VEQPELTEEALRLKTDEELSELLRLVLRIKTERGRERAMTEFLTNSIRRRLRGSSPST